MKHYTFSTIVSPSLGPPHQVMLSDICTKMHETSYSPFSALSNIVKELDGREAVPKTLIVVVREVHSLTN